MNDFRKRVVLTICLLGSLLSVLFGIRQIVKDKESENIGYSAERWDVPKFPYYTGGRAYRAPSSQSSTIAMPRVSSSSQQLFHHNAGGTYAAQGAGTYRSSYAQTGYRGSYSQSTGSVHTFSNGGIYSYGGGGGSGGAAGVTSSRKASYSGGSAGYAMPSMSISMPRARSYAYNNVQEASSETHARQGMPGRRLLPSKGEGDYDEEIQPDATTPNTWWRWSDEAEGWLAVVEGDTWMHDGETYYFNGTTWEVRENQADADSPIGDIPWLLLLLMAGGYVIARKRELIVADYTNK